MSTFASQFTVAPSWLWIAFSVGILILLFIDLLIFGRNTHKISRKAALMESGLWIAVALCFNAWFWMSFGGELGLEFLTGYLVEKSLSVDNLFVILLIFGAFKIPNEYQHRILFYGVLGAILLRAFFIVVGAQLLFLFHWILYVFGGVLVITALKFLFESDKKTDVRESWPIRFLRRIYPSTASLEKNRFFVTEGGIRKATPLLFALVAIEITDLIFAVDSIPAVFAVTQDAFVAFASNILAVLGLRALYFVLADWVGRLRYLKPGLAAILGFIGVKMLIIDWIKIPSWVSLVVIATILITAGLTSWYVASLEKKQNPKPEFQG